jgi:hypothetical protein
MFSFRWLNVLTLSAVTDQRDCGVLSVSILYESLLVICPMSIASDFIQTVTILQLAQGNHTIVKSCSS